MMPTKRQMRTISKHFKGDADMLIKTAKSVGILDPHTFLQYAVDAGLDAKGVETMMLIGRDSPKKRGTKNCEGTVFNTDRVRQKMRQLLKRGQNTNTNRKENSN